MPSNCRYRNARREWLPAAATAGLARTDAGVDRRALIAGLFAAGAASFAPAAPDRHRTDETLPALLDDLLREDLLASPELASRTGLDVGQFSGLRRRLDERSLASAVAEKRRAQEQLERLEAIDKSRLSPATDVDREAMRFTLRLQDAIGRDFAYGNAVSAEPYVVSHLTGAYNSVPNLLDSTHTVQSRSDADAYLERVAEFSKVLRQEVERLRHDAALGVIAPAFVQDRALEQLSALRNADPDRSIVTLSIARKSAAAGLSADYAARTSKLIRDAVRPALDSQIATLRRLRASAGDEAGVWRLPEGEHYYALALESATTIKRDPETIHEMGLAISAELRPQLDQLLAAQGYNRGGLADRIGALYTDPRRTRPNTPAGKADVLAELRKRLTDIEGRLPRYFRNIPKTEVEIRRVPDFRESGAPFAFYQDPSLDGSRPGVFYVNLRDTAETPMWMLTTTAFHEAIPGHHLQQALLQEGRPLPTLRKILFSSGYSEGWALYAEQLADELGLYEDDPVGRIGYVWAALLRASRMVADTGLHAKRWSRAQAIEWMVQSGGVPRGMAINEVERYCVWPGQACSYMVGKIVWLELRERAKSALGSKFDIRDFHAATIGVGSVPLAVLERVVADYIAAAGGRATASSEHR